MRFLSVEKCLVRVITRTFCGLQMASNFGDFEQQTSFLVLHGRDTGATPLAIVGTNKWEMVPAKSGWEAR
jgi:hypothetical protein